MSCSLYYRPIRSGRNVGGSALRDALRGEYGNYPFRLDVSCVPFLRGLRAAAVEGASDLIDAIEKLGVVELYTEC